jgi:ABC-type sulfate transport system substrate-binding protein
MWIKSLVALAAVALLGAAAWFVLGSGWPQQGTTELLNVSYDPTRELWRDLNARFTPAYEKETGTRLEIRQSHGGSATQARAVADGLEADVVTLALWGDTDLLRQKGLLAELRDLELFPVTTVAANWGEAQTKFFADGAIFDGIYKPEGK